MSAAPTEGARRGLVERMAESYRGPMAAMRRLLAERPSEATLLSLLLLAAVIGFVGRSFVAFGALASSGEPVDPELFRAELAAEMVGALFFAPLAVYALGALTRLAGRALGGAGDWYACRAACIWAALLSAPALALAQGATAVALANGRADSLIAGAVGLAAALYGGYLWSSCVAAAHGLSSARPVYGIAAGVLAAGYLAAAVMGAGAA